MSAPTPPLSEIVAAVAEDRIDKAVAVTLQVGAALQDQGFHIRRERKVDRRKHRVGTLAGVLEHQVASVVDEIDVVADAAVEDVGGAAAVEQVVAAVADDRVGEAVAVTLQVGASCQEQVLHVRRQREVG